MNYSLLKFDEKLKMSFISTSSSTKSSALLSSSFTSTINKYFIIKMTIIFLLFNYYIITCNGSPINLLKKSKLLFNDNNNNNNINNENNLNDLFSFLPDNNNDLQRNSARLHRTLFLLDTSNLLKKARLLGIGGSVDNNNNDDNDNNLNIKNLIERTSRIFRFKREAKPPTVESTKYINVIKVRKPFLSLNEDNNEAV